MDYKYFTFEATQATEPSKWVKPTLYGVLTCCLVMLGWLTFKPSAEVSPLIATELPRPTLVTVESTDSSLTDPINKGSQANPVTPDDNHQLVTVTVKRGDSLAKIFQAHQLNPLTLQRILDLGQIVKPLTNIKPKQRIELVIDDANRLHQISYPQTPRQTLVVRYANNEFTAELIEKPIEIKHRYVATTIQHSLYLAAKKAQLSDKVIHQFTDLFAWNIDFAKELRSGDRFVLLFEEHHAGDELIGSGNIIAAKFVNRGKIHTAIRHVDTQGNVDYFNEDGESVRKAFLRYPVKHTHISSSFNPKRLHPILKITRPHYGVDFAAALGTPIKAAGDGIIEKRESRGGYGNMIQIRHNATYKTLYAHMLRFAKDLKVGSRVKQGQVIGYVGQTGLASGPHLHYEFHANNKAVNPITVKLPTANPIAAQEREKFFVRATTMLAQLEQYEAVQVAVNEESIVTSKQS
jgi:murein DD-endopeptidase MepM/ murein hydrolase activator NlpD